jgi:inosine/xanthosine triphosphate pyrophosphatase family protein
VPRFGKTMAQLEHAEKNTISHRGMAFSALRHFIQDYLAAC